MTVWTPATEKIAYQMAKNGFTTEDIQTAVDRIGCTEAELYNRIANHKHLLEGKRLRNCAKLTLAVFNFGRKPAY